MKTKAKPVAAPRDRVAQLLDAVIEQLTEEERLMKVEGVGGVMALADVHAAGHAAWRAREELDLANVLQLVSSSNPSAQETDDGPRCA